MTEFIPLAADSLDQAVTGAELGFGTPRVIGGPSNDVYARVGDTVLRAAREGVRGGLQPDDIIREIVKEHNVRLNLGDFRLLLASRRIPERDTPGGIAAEVGSTAVASTVTQ